MRTVEEAIDAAREAAAEMAVRESFYGVAKLIRTGEEAWTAAAINSFAADYCEALAKAQQWKQLAEDTPVALGAELAAKDAEIDRLKAAAIPDGKPTPEQALKMAQAFWPNTSCIAKDDSGVTTGYKQRPQFYETFWGWGDRRSRSWLIHPPPRVLRKTTLRSVCLGTNIAWSADLPASECIYPAPEKPLAVGDWVMAPGTSIGQIKAIDDQMAWVQWRKNYYNTCMLTDLRLDTLEEIKEGDDE